MAEIPNQRWPLLTTGTTGTSAPRDMNRKSFWTAYITGSGTITGGTVIIEEADYDPKVGQIYSGTWSQISSVNASGVTTGAQQAVHSGPAAYAFIRARIGTQITGGGSVTVTIVAQ